MKKKVLFIIVGLCVLAVALIWGLNQYQAVKRVHAYNQNMKLLEQIDSLNQRSSAIFDSLKRFNPDPLLSVYENIQRSDELISHISYTKKMLSEYTYRELIENPEVLLKSDPESQNPGEYFAGSDREDNYTMADLKERVDRYIWFQNRYGGGDTTEIEAIMERLDELEDCGEGVDEHRCYASIITDLNRLILAVEELKIEVLNI